MSIGQQILFSVSALGALNGFVLSLYLLLSKKNKSTAARLLGILLLAISIRVTKSVFLYFNPQLPRIYLQIGLSACFFIGPSLYFFFKSALMKSTRVPASWKWHWGVLVGVVVVCGILIPYPRFPGTWNNIIVYVIYLQWLVYIAATGHLLKGLLKALFVAPSGLNTTERFWLWIFSGNCIIFLVYLLSLAGLIRGMYISGALSFSFILYLTIFFYLYGVKIENILQIPDEQPSKPEKRKIAETEARVWLEKLEKAVLDGKLYKDPNLKLSDLAKKIPISANLLSQLLNDNLGKSFSTYINEHRINEACKLIAVNSPFTFEAIGYEVGYNSKSTFYAAFKKIKDTTPALFKESIEKTNTV
jgi:AraC-like DNA-binding protein